MVNDVTLIVGRPLLGKGKPSTNYAVFLVHCDPERSRGITAADNFQPPPPIVFGHRGPGRREVVSIQQDFSLVHLVRCNP
jgi:hypothetical protein